MEKAKARGRELNILMKELLKCTRNVSVSWTLIKMFEAKMAGGVNDPDELVVNAFKAFDEEVEEKIRGQLVTRHILYKDDFTHILTAFGDKLTEDEIDDIL